MTSSCTCTFQPAVFCQSIFNIKQSSAYVVSRRTAVHHLQISLFRSVSFQFHEEIRDNTAVRHSPTSISCKHSLHQASPAARERDSFLRNDSVGRVTFYTRKPFAVHSWPRLLVSASDCTWSVVNKCSCIDTDACSLRIFSQFLLFLLLPFPFLQKKGEGGVMFRSFKAPH